MHWIENDSRGLQCLNCTNACSPIMKPNAITMAWVNRLSKDSFATSVVVIVWGLESTCFWTPRLPLLPITSVYLCHHHLRCGHHPHYLVLLYNNIYPRTRRWISSLCRYPEAKIPPIDPFYFLPKAYLNLYRSKFHCKRERDEIELWGVHC